MSYSHLIKKYLSAFVVFVSICSAGAQEHKVVYGKVMNNETSYFIKSTPVFIRNVYSRASVTGGTNTGGLIGKTNGEVEISQTYSTGLVEGENENTGGLIGSATGSLQTMASYWDTETSGMVNSASGTGKSKAEMTAPGNPEVYEAWNFQQIWHTDIHGINGGYPYLSNEIPQMYTLQLNSNPIQSGSTKGSGSFAYKTHIGISALANENYQFLNWSVLGQILTSDSASVVIMPDSDYGITANFIYTSGTADPETEISIFPNPFSDYFSLENASQFKQLRISDISGKPVLQCDLNGGKNIPTSPLIPGYYLITLVGIDGQYRTMPAIKY